MSKQPRVVIVGAGFGGLGVAEQLGDAGVVFFTDQQGRAFRQAADGRDRRTLGQLSELAAGSRRPVLGPEEAAAGLLEPAGEIAGQGRCPDQYHFT